MNNLSMTAWTGMTVRNLFYGGVFDRIRSEFNVSVYSNYSSQLSETFSNNGNPAEFKKLPIPRWWMSSQQSHLTNILYQWNFHAHCLSHHPASLKVFVDRERDTNTPLYLFNQLGGRLVNFVRRHAQRDQDWLRNLAYTLPIKNIASNTDVLFVASTDILRDQMLMYTYKKAGVPVVALAHSWDNLPARGLLSVKPTRLLVWNKIMLEEGVELHGIHPSCIDIVGIPQHELYRLLAETIEKRNFLFHHRIPEGFRVITFTGSAETFFPDEPDIVQALIKQIEAGRFGNAILILRLHPSERQQYYTERYADSALPIRIDTPDENFSAQSTNDIGQLDALTHFVGLMKYSDVVINMASTISLDAALFDTPVISLKFNVSLPPDAWNSALGWHTLTHFEKLSNYGAIDLPTNMEELMASIGNAILYPSEKQEQRSQLIDDFSPNLHTSDSILNSLLCVCTNA